ncbi:MAG: DnaJ domain-containing protein [Pseudonocardiales bacterium]|nr:DnaJ domain-containing protein [Pseudonocardiales bacterium]
MSTDNSDPYATLGVTPNASQAQIAHAYRRMIRAHHPDLHPNPDFAALAAAVAAYAILRDPARRAAYDQSRRPHRERHLPPPPPCRQRAVPDIRVGPVHWRPT